MELLPLAPARLTQLIPLLNRSFSGYRETLRYSLPVLSLFEASLWRGSPCALVLSESGRLEAAALAGLRAAAWEGAPLLIAHVGPVAVAPERRRQGIGRALLHAVEARAVAAGADLLTLTTEAAQPAWRLYADAGYQILERYRPALLPLAPSEHRWWSRPAPDPGEWSPPPRRGRPGAIVERAAPIEIPAALHPRRVAIEGAGVETLQWPVSSRGRDLGVRTTQVLRTWGEVRPLSQAIQIAAEAARAEGSAALYLLPSAGPIPSGFSTWGTPEVYRMVRPLTDAGRAACGAALAYDEISPAP